jgi:predicted regulator of Ras-like GTPase activity (Roadblock/LC7/MglB family)
MEGSIALTNVPDILQFLHLGNQSGELKIIDTERHLECCIYFQSGEVTHARLGEIQGVPALEAAIEWCCGYFRFKPNVCPLSVTIELPFQHLLMEVIQHRDERRQNKNMAQTQRTSTDVLQELLKIPGIVAVVVVGRDGFVIESMGNSGAVDLDSIGASLAHAVNGIEEMGNDLKIDRFTDVFIEYKRAVILCSPIGDAVAALVSPDATKLGIIRHKAKKLVEELGQYF